MAELKKQNVTISANVELVLNETELRALDALAGYGTEEFLKVFYQHLGRAYLEPYEVGLRTFLESVRGCAGLAKEAQECREFMTQTMRQRFAEQAKAGGRAKS